MSSVVLVTGVSRALGGRMAARLAADPEVTKVIGVDVIPPMHGIGDADFVRADIRNPVIARLIADEGIDTVVHMNVIATPSHAGGRSTMKEINVIGTMQLLAACQRSPSLRRLVVKSSTTVYGASPADPAVFTERMEPRSLPRSGFTKDSVEVEGYVRGFARRRSDVAVTTLRFANVMGVGVSTPLTRYFTLPVIPTVLGFDARLQFTHDEDLLDALRLAAVRDLPGTYNVAGDGVLLQSQAIRRTGRPTIPVPTFTAGGVGAAFRDARLADFTPDQLDFLTHGRVVDTTAMREVLGFEPRITTQQAFDAFVQHHGVGPLNASRIGRALAQVATFAGIDTRAAHAGVRTPGHGG